MIINNINNLTKIEFNSGANSRVAFELPSSTNIDGDRVAFKAIPLKKLQMGEGNVLRIYKLEPKEKDINYLQHIAQQIQEGILNLDMKRKNLLTDALTETIEALSLPKKLGININPEVYVAKSNNEFAGIIVGNMPKHSEKTRKPVLNTLNKPEYAEIDWLCSVKPGTGKPLVCEFFSRILEKTKAKGTVILSTTCDDTIKFYEKLGLQKIFKRPVLCSEVTKNTSYDMMDFFPECNFSDCYVIPMKIAGEKMKDISNFFFSKFKVTILKNRSVDLFKN
jgi:hypothetical protein